MINLTRLNRTGLVLNADLIESIEATPDTVICLTTGQKLVVLEAAGEVVKRVVEYRRNIYSGILHGASIADEPTPEPGSGVGEDADQLGHGRDKRARR